MTRTVANIDVKALQNNFQIAKKHAPLSKILAMIKANGYGHGIVRAAQALSHADAFGAATVEEAMILREAGITRRLVLMSGVVTVEELQLALKNNLDIVVHDVEQIKLLAKTPLSHSVKAWLKIDTGMHRLGFLPEQFATAYEQLKNISNIDPSIKLMTHLANADVLTSHVTVEQVALFEKLTANYINEKSIANSSAILAWPNVHKDWVRPGIMLYGTSPFKNKTAHALHLQPVMTLTSKLIAIKDLKKGEAVGYGGTWQCPEDMRIGVVAIGYGDGYPRHAKNGTPVLINGVRCPLSGRVSMDMITVDLRAAPNAKVGDTAILWGEGLPADEIAEWADTISYTLFCGITSRVRFNMINA